MAVPAAAMLVPVGQQAAKGAVATIEKVATTPIYSRRIKKISEDRHGEEQEVESEINITPAAVVGTALAASILGLALRPMTVTDAEGKQHTRMAIVDRPRSLLPFAGRANYPDEGGPGVGQVASTGAGWVLGGLPGAALGWLFGPR